MNLDNDSIHHCCPQARQENALDGSRFVSSGDLHERTQAPATRLVGSDLTPSDYAALEARWIDRSLADHAGFRRVDSLTGGEIIGRKSGNYAGILIPISGQAPARFATTGCDATSPTSNTIRPAI